MEQAVIFIRKIVFFQALVLRWGGRH